MLEALNVGSIDFGTAGEAPPVFAQAAGAPLVYVALEHAGRGAEAILVRPASSYKSLAELRGKRIALNKGSNVHYLLLRALESAGLTYRDIDPVFLPPADARAAFEAERVDAGHLGSVCCRGDRSRTGSRAGRRHRASGELSVLSGHQ